MNFNERVKRWMERDNWTVTTTKKGCKAQLECTRKKYKTYVYIKPHGNLSKNDIRSLCSLGKREKAHVIRAKETFGRELRFDHIWG